MSDNSNNINTLALIAAKAQPLNAVGYEAKNAQCKGFSF